MLNERVYHGSNIKGLEILEPRKSTHGESYVYGTTDKGIAALFLERWNDYIFRVDYSNGKPHIVENYPNGLEEIYRGKKGYMYELCGKSFIKKENMWGGEVVSEKQVKTIQCEFIEDILKELYEYEKRGLLHIYKYPNRPSCYPQDDSDLIEKYKLNLKTFGEGEFEKFVAYHPNLKEEAEEILDIWKSKKMKKEIYKVGIEDIDWMQLFNLYEKAGLLGRFIKNKEWDKIRRAFENSYKVVTAWDGDKLIGAGRMISDGIAYGSIFDLGVMPEYQKKGIGKALMKELLHGEEHMPIHLTSTFGNEEFYRKLGFKKHKTAHSKYPFHTDYVEE